MARSRRLNGRWLLLNLLLAQRPTTTGGSPSFGHPLSPHISSKQRAEPVPPVSHGLVADVDPALGQQVFHIQQRQREADVHHHDKADDLRRGVEIPERAG